ncbi:Gastrula zinc finger [Paramuricea clavata]|uniref:Gastrula zinc finger n=1 Tax=Paramuricea clavata TaxID=317549 RepID=A0A6S7FN27_PARCT|nr:Gastrula zinc finger [Paramuricea clavata]
MFDKNGYAKEAHRHNIAMENLTAEREKYLEEVTDRRNKIAQLKSELAEADKDINSTNKSLELVRRISELTRKAMPRTPQLSNHYKPSPEMEEYITIFSLITGGVYRGIDWLTLVTVDEMERVGRSAETMEELETAVMKYVRSRMKTKRVYDPVCSECNSKSIVLIGGAEICTDCGTSDNNLTYYISYNNNNKDDYLKKKSYHNRYMDPLDQMTASRQVVRGILVNELKRMGGLKYTETIKVRMSKEIGNDKTKKDSIYFKSKTGTATNFEDIESTAAQNQLTILSRIETFQNLGSNWIILNIESHYVNVAMYKPLKGSSYMKLPADISNPKCGLINMKNNDNKCFMWSHVRHVRPKARRGTTITRQDMEFAENLDYEGIDFPVKISDIDKIERKNGMSISVFGYKGKKQFYPIRNSKTKYDEHMELLLLGDGNGNNHYVLIKDINRMLYSVSGYEHKKHFCLHCLHSCKSEELLEKHKETCIEVNGTQATKLPKEGTKIKFKHHRNSMPAPFVIYADFESILVPEEKKADSENLGGKSSTDLYQTHKACSFGLKTVCHYDDKYSGEYISYVGEDATLVFLKTVLKESIKCREMVNKIFKKKMVITPEQEAEFWKTRNCSICGNDLGDDRVRDHDHVTGMFRGAAHNMCNLKYRITWKVPVVFHNLRGYDSHLIMQEIGKFKMNINVIPNNMEKYISFSLGKNLVFIDSIQFMASSLEALVSNLSPEDFKIVGKRWKGEDFNLVTQKGVFPYEYLNDISKLDTEGLPSRDKFYSTLYESEVKEEDYQRAQKVCQKVYQFKQSPWLKNYIDFNTKKRIMNENLIVVKRMKEVLTLNKPCYVGMSILDLSKTLMYDFHYNTIKKEYGDRSKLLFTDTDSLMYEIKTDDVYEDFRRIGEEQDCWDNSDYPKDSPYYSAHNKKVIGKFKDEAEGVPVVEFVGLRSKMYSYVKESGGGGMTAKGVKKITPDFQYFISRIKGQSQETFDQISRFVAVGGVDHRLHTASRSNRTTSTGKTTDNIQNTDEEPGLVSNRNEASRRLKVEEEEYVQSVLDQKKQQQDLVKKRKDERLAVSNPYNTSVFACTGFVKVIKKF